MFYINSAVGRQLFNAILNPDPTVYFFTDPDHFKYTFEQIFMSKVGTGSGKIMWTWPYPDLDTQQCIESSLFTIYVMSGPRLVVYGNSLSHA